MEPNPEEIERALVVLFQPGDTVELRCVGGITINGFYRDLHKLAQDAATLNSSSFQPTQNVYVLPNPVDPELYGRRADEFGRAKKGEAVNDCQVCSRRWLLVDVDCIRPAGVSASNLQKQAALHLAKQVYAWLQGQLGSACIVCGDSGNGAHMLIRLPDWPVNSETRWVSERFLRLLSERFANDQAKVDRTTFNAARICTLYGTVKRKGLHVPDQPHRLSSLVHVPVPLEPVAWSTMVAITGPYPGEQATVPPPANVSTGPTWDVEQLLQQHGLHYTRDDQYLTNSGEQATRWELQVCPWNSNHNNGAAWIIQWPSGAVAAGCHHDGCAGKDWQALKQQWQLTHGNYVSGTQIILPMSSPVSSMSSVSSISYNPTPVSCTSSMSSMSLESYISPPVIESAAFYGPLGQVAADLEHHSEASSVAVLACSLLYYGNAIGRSHYVRLDERHYPKLYVALVGPTGTGRKGTADSQAQRVIDAVDGIAEICRHSGLSTGEGLLQILDQNRDGMFPRPAVFVEREFAAVFRRAERKGNTLNSFIRDAWDDKPLANSSLSSPMRVADHHISVVAHVTPSELKRLLCAADVANGFSNRFLWIYSRRPNRMPNARGFEAVRYSQQIKHLQKALEKARAEYVQAGTPLEIPFTPEASAVWKDQYYPQLDLDSDDDTQLILMCNRQAQQTVRLALIFSLADNRREIGLEHLHAARAIVEYVWNSLDYILSRDWWGDPGNAHDPAGMAPRLLEVLQDGPKTRSQIMHHVFNRNRTAKEINGLRNLLIHQKKIVVSQSARGELWQRY